MITMIRRTLLASIFMLSAGPVLAQTGDVPGSQDHRLLSRYEGSVIIDYETKDFDDYELLLGPNSGKAKNLDEGQRLEGAVTKIRYLAPKGRSTLEVYRNYENALKQAGFEILFACADRACGRHFTNIYKDRNRDYLLRKGKEQRFLAARVVGEEGDVFVSLLVNHHDVLDEFADQPVVQLDVIEIEPLEDGKVIVDADALARDLDQTGHAAVYGIYFDVDEAVVKPESAPALEEIAKLLKKQSDLKFYVVGHTDNTGTLAHNMDLSQRRAEAVVHKLVTDYDIAAEHLAAVGVGPVAPVASNDAGEGRALNRRVELVLF